MMRENNKKAELLSPAASFDSVIGVLNAGADAIYIGGRLFGARAYAENMEADELLEALDYAHLHNKKVYLTVNTLLKDLEIEHELYNYLAPYYERGLDAVIVQDLGALSFIRSQFPDLPIHASTQMTLTGSYAPAYLERIGVQRIVTPRELSLSEIAAIKQAAPQTEIESFVHGALCVGYSGQCFFSSFLGERSGNRGRCAQPCRLPYALSDGKKQLTEQSFLLSPKDMCAIETLPQIIEAGVYSLKIEGRMKRPEYMAGVTAVYRKYLDLYLTGEETRYIIEEDDKKLLLELYNRGGFHDGYYFRRHGKDMISAARPNHHGILVGKIDNGKKGLLFCAEENINNGDVLELRFRAKKTAISKNKDKSQTGCEAIQIAMKKSIKSGQKLALQSLFAAPMPKNWGKADVYRIHNEQLMIDIKQRYLKQEQKIKAFAKLTVQRGKPLSLTVWKGEAQTLTFGAVVQTAKKQAVQEQQLLKQLNKTGNTPFQWEKAEIEMEDQCFVALGEINEIRRKALKQLEETLLDSYVRERMKPQFKTLNQIQDNQEPKCCEQKITTEDNADAVLCDKNQTKLLAYVSTKEQARALMRDKWINGCYLDINMFSLWRGKQREQELQCYHDIVERLKIAGKKVYLSLPAIMRNEDEAKFFKYQEQLFSCLDGALVHNFEQLCMLRELQKTTGFNLEIIGDYTLYNMNRETDAFLKEFGLAYSSFPLELTERELKALASQSALKREFIFYGYLPMMFCAQCQAKNANLCERRSKTLFLQDRKQQRLTVATHCDYCYNVIYNSVPLSLFGLEAQVRQLRPKAVRLQFLAEPAKRMQEIIEEFALSYFKGKSVSSSITEFTRGHFKRGVE